MKKLITLLSLALALAMVLPVAAAGPAKASVFLLISGSLGDKGFNDSAKAGLDMMKAKYGDRITTKYTELGSDAAKYSPALEDAGAEGYSVVLCSNNFNNAVQEVAARYPKTLYIMYDGWTKEAIANSYQIQYKNSEAGYLAGALAGLMTQLKSSDSSLNSENVIGFIGGRDITGINDFFVGYIAGAQKVNSKVKIIYNYVNSFTDTAKAKDQALIQFKTYKADVVYHAAGRAGLGLFDAAAETDRYAIGVDTNQAALFGNEPKKADQILTSTMKRVDLTLFQAVSRFMEGEKLGGQQVYIGAAEGAIAYAPFSKVVPASMQKDLEKVQSEIKAGTVKIPSAFSMTADQINAMRDAVNAAKK